MILSNQRRCTECGDKPFSRTRHDYRECSCGKVMVDGGQEYLRQSCNDGGESMNIVVDTNHSDGLQAVIERTNLTPFGKVCHLALYLRDEMGINIGATDDDG